MNYKLILASVMDELAIAMDGTGDRFGSDAQGRGGWLEAHDRRFHGGHFDPETQTCGLRDKMQSADNADYIAGSDANGARNPIPMKSEFSDILGAAYSAGLLSQEDGNEIDAMYNAVSGWMDSAEEGADVPNDIKEQMQALADINTALSQIVAANAEQQATAAANAEQPATLTPAMRMAQVADGTLRVAPIGRLSSRIGQSLASSFPTNNTWNRQLLRAVGKATKDECVAELLAHPENPRYKNLLDGYTEHALRHPSAWTARFMGAVERMHPNWREEGVAAAALNEPEHLRQLPSAFSVSLTAEELAELSRCSNDSQRANLARRSYERRRAIGQTSRIEDVFATKGVYCLGPGRIGVVGVNRDHCCCFACHGVTAMRSLYGAVCDPQSYWSESNKGKVWFEVRGKAFSGAKALISADVCTDSIRNAPNGSVVLVTSGGHCYNYYKDRYGNWKKADTFSGEYNQVSVNDVINKCSFYVRDAASVERMTSSRLIRRLCEHGNIPENMPRDVVTLGGKGAILMTPDKANDINPEYLLGCITGQPTRDVSPVCQSLFERVRFNNTNGNVNA